MERFAALVKENLRFHLPIPFVLSLGLVVLSPLFVGIRNLSPQETAKVLEYVLVFLGILLFPPVFLPEQNPEVRDLLRARYTSLGTLYGIRVILALLSALALTGVYLAVLKEGNCSFELWKSYGGTISGIVFLGGIGIFAYGLTSQVVIGYMIPLLYYVLCMGAGPKKMGVFYLFAMTQGEFSWKIWQAGAGVLLLGAGILLQMRKDR